MFSEEFNVRFYETDALAHVSNTVLVGWFESGREPIFKLFNPELDLQNWPLILASSASGPAVHLSRGRREPRARPGSAHRSR